MPKFKNVSPLGALDLPLIGRVVEHDEVIEVSEAQAERLTDQPDWEPVKTRSTKDPDDLVTPAVPTDVPATPAPEENQ